jgi:MOSC domain-containing protein YiiM
MTSSTEGMDPVAGDGSVGDGPGSTVVGALVSVNVGAPRPVEWFGRVVRTAIWKQPVAGRVEVRGVNVAGDDQADRRVHGGIDKAVYAYAAEDYAWWSEGRADPLAPGTFGDNLTTSGVDLREAWIGERWAVGDAVFEVSEPRTPCFKLGIRMGDAGFVEQFESAGRFGTYLRIIEPGTVGAGDAIRLVSRPSQRVTVAELASARHEGDASLLRRVAAHPSVPAQWRDGATRALGRA